MPSNLNRTDTISSGDLFVLYTNNNGDWRGATTATVLSYLQNNLTFATQGFGAYTTQYSSPSATSFTVTITDGDSDNTNVHLILTPTAGFAAGTIKLPLSTGVVDKQEVLVNCTQAVTTLTIDGNGATAVTGEPTTLAANAFFRLKYDSLTSTWYRVG
jgi:hypothetical protein